MLYIYPFKGGDKSDDKFKTFDDNKDELGFAAKPISKILKVTEREKARQHEEWMAKETLMWRCK